MGRPVGVPNTLKATLMARLDAKFPGWHPIIQMAGIANDEAQPIELRFNAAKEVAKYVVPQLKAVTHVDEEGRAIAPVFAMVVKDRDS
jgi:hypothetical protein